MLCPNCDKLIEPENISEYRIYDIEDESITILDHIERCPECKAEWSQDGFDYLDEVYNVYRKRKGFLQPEDIRSFRENKGLSLKELADLTDIDEELLHFYERGNVQSAEDDKLLRSILLV